ncbi:MAG: hypothetical protein KatS3mg038_3228 [Candidatus Kapaibacterium sp.]|nr:MAG: hypothetical protein KatS3mg038_0826 [Candidatus Kapabacteria bacterium]GIV51689.1 MAG: hypothetical protein KatS3mg038_2210 [Candidatus Kapabacteria bacterium]GIV52576.1 MAG: hypothetical protein KatS3mg038_3097 [Candidatus Kapabacteria bacterium]GIV52707.1 MAG: hypothetical protein KatS3mg038_3228 [Candidatus Kapabacteria bacterium]
MRPAPVSEYFMFCYLDENDKHPAKPWTVGTFLTRRLRGRAKAYKGHYQARVLARLVALEKQGLVRCVRSAGGGTAWVRVR